MTPEDLERAGLDALGKEWSWKDMRRRVATMPYGFALVVATILGGGMLVRSLGPAVAAQGTPAVERLRLYVFDLGFLPVPDAGALFTEPLEVAPDGYCVIVGHLIVYPKGTLIWDAGVVPDDLIGSVEPGSDRGARPLREQLAEIGYDPSDITYFALSHYHFDHTANANDFRDATWIVQKAERDAMFSGEVLPGVGPEPASQYAELEDSTTIILSNVDEYDLFGDGTVVIKAAPGHTPGYQVLILRLPETGPVMLGGDLYHFREEREAQRIPTIEFDPEQSRATRVRIEEYVREHAMPMWIEYDARLYATLAKSPTTSSRRGVNAAQERGSA